MRSPLAARPSIFKLVAQSGTDCSIATYVRTIPVYHPGDRVCWYLTGIQAFAATATITSPYFEGSEAIWISEKTGDTYPWRFKIKKDHAVDPDRAVKAESLLAKLAHVKRWPKEHWRLAFQGNVHELDAKDFAVIEAAIAAVETQRSAA